MLGSSHRLCLWDFGSVEVQPLRILLHQIVSVTQLLLNWISVCLTSSTPGKISVLFDLIQSIGDLPVLLGPIVYQNE